VVELTIREFVIGVTLEQQRYNVKKLIEINAPKVVIENTKQIITDLENGELSKVGGKKELLDYEYNQVEFKRGNRGMPYIQFDSKINYFPCAQFGRYINYADNLHE
jgi:hypothetical protein